MGKWHPECPDRLDAINDQLLASGLKDHLDELDALPASDADILRIHGQEYLQYLKKHSPSTDYFSIDPDTLMNAHTLDAAYVAAGAGITAVDEIMGGKYRNAFCAVRPPGHHARPDQAMGFCFFNNIAIAAAYALDRYGLERVAILDFDVHHGNGTEESFAHDGRVLMCSFYQSPLFPHLHMQPEPDNMVNVPVPAYTKGPDVRQLIQDLWMPRLRAFAPQLLLISAGFDGHREDDMAQLGLVESDYAWMTEQLVNIADTYAEGRIISFLEGGYALSALGRSVAAHIRALAKL